MSNTIQNPEIGKLTPEDSAALYEREVEILDARAIVQRALESVLTNG